MGNGLDTRQDEPDDSAPQEYCVIPPLLPNPDPLKDWEVPRENLVFVKVIGKGAFGQVAKGMVLGLDNSKENRLVAIKMLRGRLTYLLLEGKFLLYFCKFKINLSPRLLLERITKKNF